MCYTISGKHYAAGAVQTRQMKFYLRDKTGNSFGVFVNE